MKKTFLVPFFIGLFIVPCLAQTKEEISNAPTIDFCDLVKNPLPNDERIVRITAIYTVGFEGSLFNGANCQGKDIWVSFDKALEQNTNPKIFKKFKRYTDVSPVKTKGSINYPTKWVQVSVIGRFQGTSKPYKIGQLTFKSGYGHLNGFDYNFNILVVEKVKRLGSM